MLKWLTLIALVPLALPAQPPPRGPRPWWDSQVSRELNLSDAQTKQLRQIQDDFRPRMTDLRSAVNKAETDVNAAFNEDPVDQAKANDAISRLAAARGELTKAVSQMDLRLRMTLTAQQWQQLNQRQRPPWPDRGGPRRRGPSTGPAGASATTNQQK